jgi:hypothetical protein
VKKLIHSKISIKIKKCDLYPKNRRSLVKHGKGRFVYKSTDTDRSKTLRGQMQDPSLRINLISGPQNFRHLTHMGPESGLQMMSTEPTQIAKDSGKRTSFISGPSNFKGSSQK